MPLCLSVTFEVMLQAYDAWARLGSILKGYYGQVNAGGTLGSWR